MASGPGGVSPRSISCCQNRIHSQLPLRFEGSSNTRRCLSSIILEMKPSSGRRLVRALRRAYEQKKGRQAVEGAEAGFTLIELMVVLLIMAILLAIAIPTFLGVKTGAQDRAVQSNLTNAMTSAKAAYANGGTYATTAAAEVTSLGSAEPNITFETAAATSGTNNLSVSTSTDGQELLLVGYSQSGQCWASADNEGTTAAISGAPVASALGVEYTNWTETSTNTCNQTGLAAAAPTWRSHY
jgi:type IV pilus assembly protein PilA